MSPPKILDHVSRKLKKWRQSKGSRPVRSPVGAGMHLRFEPREERRVLNADSAFALAVGMDAMRPGARERGDTLATGDGFIVSGVYGETIDFGDGVLRTPEGGVDGVDAFVAKYDSELSLVWVKTLNGNDEEFARPIDVSADGETVYAASTGTPAHWIGALTLPPKPL